MQKFQIIENYIYFRWSDEKISINLQAHSYFHVSHDGYDPEIFKLREMQDNNFNRFLEQHDLNILHCGSFSVLKGADKIKDIVVNYPKIGFIQIGDAVNLAARLEGETRNYGTEEEKCYLIISEFTYEKVKDICTVTHLGAVKVKGKNKPVDIYQVDDVKMMECPN